MPAPPVVVITLYTSTTPSSSKQRTECARFAQLLAAKKVKHVEVDLASDSTARLAMLAGSDGVDTIPQLHVNGKLVGDFSTCQEMEDFGELDAALKPPKE